MTQFTKEELITLNEAYGMWEKRFGSLSKATVALGEKLESMIVSYCEHGKVVPNYDCKTQCEKCGMIL